MMQRASLCPRAATLVHRKAWDMTASLSEPGALDPHGLDLFSRSPSGAEREMNVIFDPKNGLELDSTPGGLLRLARLLTIWVGCSTPGKEPGFPVDT